MPGRGNNLEGNIQLNAIRVPERQGEPKAKSRSTTKAGPSRQSPNVPTLTNNQRNIIEQIKEKYKLTSKNPTFIQDIKSYATNKNGINNSQKSNIITKALKVHLNYKDWRYINLVDTINNKLKNPNKTFYENFKNIYFTNNNKVFKTKMILNALDINKNEKSKPFSSILKLKNNSRVRNFNPVLRTFVTNKRLSELNDNSRKRILENNSLRTKRENNPFYFNAINIKDDRNILFFLQLIYDDIVHDGQINKSNNETFKNMILEKFIMFKNDENNKENKKYMSALLDKIVKNKTKTRVNTNAKNNINRELNQNDTFKIVKPMGLHFSTQNSQNLNFKKYLVKYKNGKRGMYQGFDVVYNSNTSTTPIIKMMYSLFLKPKKEKNPQGSRPIASSSISYATYLDPGFHKRNHKNGSILIHSLTKNKSTLIKINDKNPTYVIYYFDDNDNLIGETQIGAYFQSGKYYIKLNNKTILIQSKNRAESPINKFLGDFMLILTSLRSSYKARAYATHDKSAALMYIFMCKMKDVKPRLIFSRQEGSQGGQKDILFFKGFGDILINPTNNGMYQARRRILTRKPTKTSNMSGPQKRERAYYSATNSNNKSFHY
jgi:hypothetical protein